MEPGVIIEQRSESTYLVSRHNRSRKKRATLNISQLRPRHSHEAADDLFPLPHAADGNAPHPAHPAPLANDNQPQPQPQQQPRRSPRLQAQLTKDQALHIAALKFNLSLTHQIAHLLPPFARELPILDAIPFIQHHRVTSEDLVKLILSGWSMHPLNPSAERTQLEQHAEHDLPDTCLLYTSDAADE